MMHTPIHRISQGASVPPYPAALSKSSMPKLPNPIIILILLAVLMGCFGGAPPTRSYFSLQYPTDGIQRYESAKYPVILRVRPFTAGVAYDKQEIVFRTSSYEFQYYWYKLWAAKPKRMLEELTASYLRDAGLFQEIIRSVTTRVPDLDLDCEVLAIEELDSTESTWFARLSLRYTLIRTADRSVLWEYTFDEKKPVYTHTPTFVVKVMTEVLAEQLAKMTDSLDAYLATADLDSVARPVQRIGVPTTIEPNARPAPKRVSTPTSGSEETPQPPTGIEPPAAEPKPSATLRR